MTCRSLQTYRTRLRDLLLRCGSCDVCSGVVVHFLHHAWRRARALPQPQVTAPVFAGFKVHRYVHLMTHVSVIKSAPHAVNVLAPGLQATRGSPVSAAQVWPRRLVVYSTRYHAKCMHRASACCIDAGTAENVSDLICERLGCSVVVATDRGTPPGEPALSLSSFLLCLSSLHCGASVKTPQVMFIAVTGVSPTGRVQWQCVALVTILGSLLWQLSFVVVCASLIRCC